MKYNIKRNVVNDNPLWNEDKKLFEFMDTKAISDNEREFFEMLHYKQVNNLAIANDLIMSEKNNQDHLFIIRINADEYIIGTSDNANNVHTMSLFEALNTNLKSAGLLDRDINLWDWLRERDYMSVEYEHNFNDI